MEHGLIYDIAVCIIAAWVLAVICQVAKQPLLLAYLLAGFVIGPHGFRWVTNPESIQTIASLGLALLLFLIGLEMDLKKMLRAGKALTLTALIQILGCIAFGLAVLPLLGLSKGHLETTYLAVAAAMSSTVIIVKILHDKHELETLAGRITLGVLVLQDLAVILFLAIQPNLKNPAAGLLALAFGKVLLLVGVAYVVSRFLLPPIFKFVATHPELVLVGALAWCFALAGLAGELGLSREMGALLAGVMVSTFPYALDLVARVTSIRDFFVTLFFVGLGMTIPWPTLDLFGGMLLLSAFLVGSRIFTVFTPLYLMRLGHRVSLLPAINLCQLSELSLVLLALGVQSGDVSPRVLNIAALAFAFLALDSTYAIFRSDSILAKASPWLKKVGVQDLPENDSETQIFRRAPTVFLLGFSSSASSLLEEITRKSKVLLSELCVVDFNPIVHQQLTQRGICAIYGDIAQPDTLLHAGIAKAEIVICSLPDTILKGCNNERVLRQVRDLCPDAHVIVHAAKLTDIPALYTAGASYVLAPRLLEATELLNAIEAARKNLLYEKRDIQLQAVEGRLEVLA
jgi:Kef-type K+ transport system membrane component KefB